MSKIENKFLQSIKKIDPEGFVEKYNIDRKFEEETGITGKRFSALVQSEARTVTLEEMKALLEYYKKKTGIENIQYSDLFPLDEDKDKDKK
jgi:predicted GTPase